MAATGSDERLVPLPPPPIAARAVRTMIGYRTPPTATVHRGLPSPYLTLVFSLSGPLPIEVPRGGATSAGRFGIPVGGLHTRPVLLPPQVDGGVPVGQRGIQLAVHPFASRALFGVQAGDLHGEVIELGDLAGGAASVLGELSAAAVGSTAAADRVNAWLGARLAAGVRGVIAPELHRAWQLIVGSGGSVRVCDVAADVGWSRRHLTAKMRAEIGVGTKDLARLSRFGRSKTLLTSGSMSLTDLAAACGYADQSHLTAEWRQFAGCAPGQWMAAEGSTLAPAG